MKAKISLALILGIWLLGSFNCAESTKIKTESPEIKTKSTEVVSEDFEDENNEIICCAIRETLMLDEITFGSEKDSQNIKANRNVFSPGDEIHIFTGAKYTSAAHKIRVVLFYENVAGREPNSIATDCGEIETKGEKAIVCRVSSKSGRILPGRYRAEAVLLGTTTAREYDRRAATFEVADN